MSSSRTRWREARCALPVHERREQLQTARQRNGERVGLLELEDWPVVAEDGGGAPPAPPPSRPPGRGVLTGPPGPPAWWFLAMGVLGYAMGVLVMYGLLRWLRPGGRR